MAGGCVPGQGTIPDSFVGQLVCGTWLPNNHGWNAVLRVWPAATAVVVLLLAVRIGWGWARRAAWRRAAHRAVWLEITPPVSAGPATTLALWRLLATVLPAPGRFALRARRVVFEVHADANRMRAGIWVPPGINPLSVARAVQRAWPGARVAEAALPRLPDRCSVVGRAVTLRQPDWLPLVDLDQPAPHHGDLHGGVAVQTDPLRAVYDALAAAGRSGGGLVQVIAGRAPGRRLARARLAMRDPAKARRAGAARGTDLVLRTVVALLRAVLDLIQPGKPANTTRPSPLSDPFLAEQARAARAKYAIGPHLQVAVRVITAGPTVAAARASSADVTAGYALVSTVLGRRRLHRARHAARYRYTGEAAMFLATTVEVAALAGLPAEPASYGLPGAASHRRGGGADDWREPGYKPDRSGGSDPDDDDDFGIWSLV
jgi:hypothetical protein